MTELLEAFGALQADEGPTVNDAREERIRGAFLRSKESYPTELIYTEAQWYYPPEVPPARRQHVRHVDYTLNMLYSEGRHEEALCLACSQLADESLDVFDARTESREKELLDIAIRCAVRLPDKNLPAELADRAQSKWENTPALAAISAEAYLSSHRPRDALSASLCAIALRGILPTYTSLLERSLGGLREEAGQKGGTRAVAALDQMLSRVGPRVKTSRPLFPELQGASRSWQPLTEAQKSPVPPGEAEAWCEALNIEGIDKKRLLDIFCYDSKVDPDQALPQSEFRSVRTL